MAQHIEIDRNHYELNDKGYLVDMTTWNGQLRDFLAQEHSIVLTEDHHAVLAYLRTYFKENEVHPVIRMITTAISEQMGPEKGSAKYFHELFPAGLHQAFIIAGLPMKHSCC